MLDLIRNLLRLPRVSAVPSGSHFRAILNRERSRADRNGSVVSLLEFTLSENNNKSGQQAVEDISNYLQERLRVTDDFGLLAPDTVGIVLPETGLDGAEVVARDVRSTMEPVVGKLSHQIYEYPDSNFPANTDKDSSDEGSNNEDSGLPVGKETVVSAAASSPNSRTLRSGLATRNSLTPFLSQPIPVWKRALDLAGSGIGLLLLSPVFLVVACGIRLSSPGPVFFAQRRTGIGGKPFTMFKFRSMVPTAESQRDQFAHLNERDGPAFKISNDPRITPIGNLLRKTNIDELPQLLNVFFGQMSLVGPRPLPCAEAEACRGWHRRRMDVIPGMTCIWQVSDREGLTFEEWVRMDVEYSKRVSLLQDIKLLLATPLVFLRGDK